MKVLTLNTHSWLEDDQEAKLKVIAQEIAAGDYDLIALQEVNQSIAATTIVRMVFIVRQRRSLRSKKTILLCA